MNCRSGVLALWAMGILVGACGMERPRSEEGAEDATATDISERIEGYLAAIDRRDIHAAADYWTEDARLTGPGIDLSRSAILEGMRTVFNAGTTVQVLARPTLELFVHGDVAYEIAQAEEVFVNTGAPPDTIRNNMFIRWERGPDGVWRFDRVLLSPEAPAP